METGVLEIIEHSVLLAFRARDSHWGRGPGSMGASKIKLANQFCRKRDFNTHIMDFSNLSSRPSFSSLLSDALAYIPLASPSKAWY
jgi:hypothetical protein